MRIEDDHFDELAYLEMNPDVEAAVLAGAFASGYEHWAKHGRTERRTIGPVRRPVDAPDTWDETRYLRANRDVLAAVKAGAFRSGYDHWLHYGSNEGRLGGIAPAQKTPAARVLSQLPLGFNCFGYRSAATGLGSALRGHLDVLRGITGNVVETEVPVWGMHSPHVPKYDPSRNPFAFNIIHQNPDVLGLFLTHYGRKTLEDRINIGCWVWELHAGYPDWRRYSGSFHEVWSPTQFVADSLRTVCAAPIHVVPYPVDRLPLSPTKTRSDFGLPENAFIFTYVFDLASALARKNPLALLRAFHHAFGDRTDVCLALKYHNVSSDAAGAATLERLASGARNVKTFNQTMPIDQVYSLIQVSDCFVSPHRSEGFGLNIATAMYYGKPVIATGYSGNMDFTTEESAFLIDYDLVPVGPGQPHYREGYGWADPAPEHLRSLLQLVHTNRDLATRVAHAGQRLVREKYSVEAIEKIVRFRISALNSR